MLLNIPMPCAFGCSMVTFTWQTVTARCWQLERWHTFPEAIFLRQSTHNIFPQRDKRVNMINCRSNATDLHKNLKKKNSLYKWWRVEWQKCNRKINHTRPKCIYNDVNYRVTADVVDVLIWYLRINKTSVIHFSNSKNLMTYCCRNVPNPRAYWERIVTADCAYASLM